MGTGLEEKGSGGWESGDSFSSEEKQIHANAVGLVNAQREAGTQLAAWSVFLYWATTLVKGTYHPPNWQTTGNTTTKRNVEISEIEKTIT